MIVYIITPLNVPGQVIRKNKGLRVSENICPQKAI